MDKELNKKLARLNSEKQEFLYQRNHIQEWIEETDREIKEVEKLIDSEVK